MLTTPRRGTRRIPHVLASLLIGAMLALGGLVAPTTASAAEAELPDVIPSLDGWQSSSGVFTATEDMSINYSDDALASAAEITAEELSAAYSGADAGTGSAEDGDIQLALDPSRSDLGSEGYELVVDGAITITAATRTGAFYGTRTLTQMLTQQETIPQGSVVDVPSYQERGVTLCACVINISPDWIDRLIEEMSYLKLNTLMVEMKLKVDEYPETNTWSYYTKDDVKQLVAKAEKYGIDVIPEINSPGHMEIWLENLPDLQLTNEQTGEKDEVRMDITKQRSFDFYTDLIDEYAEVFPSTYWHMGVDEYMLGSGYKNYPQILEFAHEKFGPDATENDVVAWYVNKVNDYVKEKGKTLRIWNDGVMTENAVVPFDTDIVVEHWNQSGSSVTPQQFVDWGHETVNVSNSLYMVRGGYGIDAEGLYNSDWTPTQFYGSSVTDGADAVRGARMSMWPDAGTPDEAENTTEDRMFEGLRLTAQTTWADSRPWATYSDFETAMDAVGRPPLWENTTRLPVDDGTYTIAAADGSGALAFDDGEVVLGESGEPLTMKHTDDDYYTLTSEDGRCLDLSRSGTMRLDVPVQIGADVVLSDCDDTTIQKWQISNADEGFTIVNAASQQHLSISDGLVDVPVSHEKPQTVEDGQIVQTPADWGATVWELTGDVAMTASLSDDAAAPGDSTTGTVTVNNGTGDDITNATVRLSGIPDGWTALPREVAVKSIAAGESATVEFDLLNAIASSDSGDFAFELIDGDEAVLASASTSVRSLCTTETMQPTAVSDVSSEQTSGEPEPSGFADAAIDGDPETYWHSQWSAPEAEYPHEIVVDLGEEQTACGLWYTARSSSGSGGENGRIADYEVYTSTDASTIDGEWGEAVARGTFSNTADPQLADFHASDVRYIKLVALSEVNGNPWATVGELSAAAPVEAVPTYDPAMDLSPERASPGDDVIVSGSGFAPGETVTAGVEGAPSAKDAGEKPHAVANADGAVEVTLVVPEDAQSGEGHVTAKGAVTEASAQGVLMIVGDDPAPGDGSGGGSDSGSDGPADGSSGSGGDGAAGPGDSSSDHNAAGPHGSAGSGSDDATGELPYTGADIAGLVTAAFALLTLGAALYARRRGSARRSEF